MFCCPLTVSFSGFAVLSFFIFFFSSFVIASSVSLDYGHKSPIHVSMLPNPSHLEAVDPVVAGKARGRQWILKDGCYGDRPDCQMGDKVSLSINFILLASPKKTKHTM